jgi:hypothetical protein
MSAPDPFIVHSAEQVLRFTRANHWDDLSEARKVQLGFNMGVFALGLGLSKEESFIMLTHAHEGRITMDKFHEHLLEIIDSKGIVVDHGRVLRPF